MPHGPWLECPLTHGKPHDVILTVARDFSHRKCLCFPEIRLLGAILVSNHVAVCLGRCFRLGVFKPLHDRMMSPIRRLCHWGPLASMAITASLTVATLSTKISLPICLIFQLTMCFTLYNLWCATLLGPGYLPSGEEIEPTAGRFCKACARIIARKHHHCPWINNCVGQNNEHYFIRFLKLSAVAALQSGMILVLDSYHRYQLANMFLLFNIFNIGLSIGIIIAVSVLLYTH